MLQSDDNVVLRFVEICKAIVYHSRVNKNHMYQDCILEIWIHLYFITIKTKDMNCQQQC